MIVRPKARELIVGVADDPTFGPVIAFGQGLLLVALLFVSAVFAADDSTTSAEKPAPHLGARADKLITAFARCNFFALQES